MKSSSYYFLDILFFFVGLLLGDLVGLLRFGLFILGDLNPPLEQGDFSKSKKINIQFIII